MGSLLGIVPTPLVGGVLIFNQTTWANSVWQGLQPPLDREKKQ